jgi:RNA polymerase sigma factor (sigma-70 family)
MEVNPNWSTKAKRDYELVQRAKAGEDSAFTELLDIYRDHIYYMLLRKLNNPVDAEDVTIEAFGKAFKSLYKYEPCYAFSTWLFTIANNNCIDFIRKQKFQHLSLDNKLNEEEGEETFDVASEMLDPEERLIKEQKSDFLSDVVQRLKPRYSKLIKNRYYKEMSYKEIAEQMQIPLGTVKARLYRSRELLHAILYPDEKNL